MQSTLIGLVTTSGWATAQPDVVATVAAGHRQTVESIQTLQLRFSVEQREGADVRYEVESYWQAGAVHRVRKSHGAGTPPATGAGNADVLEIGKRGGRAVWLFNKSELGQKDAYITVPDDAPFSDFVWSVVAARVSDRPPRWLKDALIGDAAWSWTGEWTTLGAARVAHLTGRYKGEAGESTYELWADPAVGYWPRKGMSYGPFSKTTRDDPVSQFEVTRFHPPYKSTGISFPAAVTKRRGAPAGAPKVEAVHTFRLDDVRINDPVPDSLLDVTIPPGYQVADKLTGRLYTTGPDGKPVNPQPLVMVEPPPAPPPPGGGWGVSNYLLLVGGVVGSASGATLLARRRAARRAAPPTGKV